MANGKGNIYGSELSAREASIAEALDMSGEEDAASNPPRAGAVSQYAYLATVTTISSREMNQDLARAKRAAVQGPVIITDRGTPAFVLTTFADYQRTHTKRPRLTASEALGMDEDIEFELPERVPHIPTIEFD